MRKITEKKERSLGVKLFLKGERCNSPKCVTVRRPSRPGMHGSRRSTLTDYGRQLKEKQKIQFFYGLNNTQLQKLFRVLSTKEIIVLLIHRLDQVVFLFGFAKSSRIARQLISHGHILVNGKRVMSASYRVRKGDVISIRIESKDHKEFEGLKERLAHVSLPSWLTLNVDEMKGTCAAAANVEDIQFPFDINLVGQFYSR